VEPLKEAAAVQVLAASQNLAVHLQVTVAATEERTSAGAQVMREAVPVGTLELVVRVKQVLVLLPDKRARAVAAAAAVLIYFVLALPEGVGVSAY
jgi:hypothetical protein